MIKLLQALWAYKPPLRQRFAGGGNAHASFVWMEKSSGASIEKEWLPRWSGYLTLIQMVGKWAQGFESGKVHYSAKMESCLAAFIALYDDYTDDFDLKHHQILELLKSDSPKDSRQRLFIFLYKKILEIHPNPAFFEELLYKGGAAQDLSLKQKEVGTSQEILWEVTHKKGGYFTLICFSGFIKDFTEAQQDYIYELGANIQLLNDTFDVYKDTQAGIFTLPDTAPSIAAFASFYEERISNWMKREIPFPVDAAGQSSLRAQFALPFATGMVCLKQFKALETKYGAFTPANFSRNELVCDMDSIPKMIEMLREARKLLRK